jgi:TATA-binding protein-associated factor
LICRHKLVLSGTPVQNKVHEVWATFDFLMPNFLGSSAAFSKEFAKPITKSQAAGASASDIANGIECLKSLHQQVLPFILRREKEHVLKELPPKSVSIIPCQMSPLQKQILDDFSASGHAKNSLHSLHNALKSSSSLIPKLGKDVLKSLLFLRLLCTHPVLTVAKQETASNNLEHSGKLVALSELLRDAGIQNQGLVAADNDPSLLYCDDNSDDEADDFDAALETGLDESLVALDSGATGGSRCLIFAQFMSSLDIVETSLLKRYLPSVAYLRLDGRVPAEERSKIVDRFNEDEDVKILLLTTRIGGLGLNLTGKYPVFGDIAGCCCSD